MANLNRATQAPTQPTIIQSAPPDPPPPAPNRPPVLPGATMVASTRRNGAAGANLASVTSDAPATNTFQPMSPMASFDANGVQHARDAQLANLDMDKTLAVIRRQETGSFDGDYTKTTKAGSASGAYQFTDGTWRDMTRKYGVGTEYARAKDAPPDVQDALMKARVQDLYLRHGGDLEKVYNTHFTGNAAGKMSASAKAVNNGATADSYRHSIANHEAEYTKRKSLVTSLSYGK